MAYALCDSHRFGSGSSDRSNCLSNDYVLCSPIDRLRLQTVRRSVVPLEVR